MQREIAAARIRPGHAPSLSAYRWNLSFLFAFVALGLLALVDIRRGFLFNDYPWATPWAVFCPWHPAMLGVATGGAAIAYVRLRRREGELAGAGFDGLVRLLALALFGLLVIDLLAYRAIAAERAASAGRLAAGWLDAFGIEGWTRPFALTGSYLLTVWHATLLGVLLAGLALTVLPRYLRSLFERTGVGGSLFGAAFALPQPFCSCCAAVVSPSLARRGASSYFLLAFAVGSPMLNVTAIVLAALLLPAPFAVARIVAGIVLTVPVTFAVARLADRLAPAHDHVQGAPSPARAWMTRWLNAYCRIFHVDEMVEGRRMDTPTAFLGTWLTISARIALLIVPTLVVFSLVTSAIVQVLPDAYGNNWGSVVLTSVAGTLLMVSTWTEIPVTQQLIGSGMPGPAAVLLVVLPPVSLPSLLLLGSALGRFRAVAILGAAVTLVGVVTGLAFLLWFR